MLLNPDNEGDNLVSVVYFEEHGFVTEAWTLPVKGEEPAKLIIINYHVDKSISGTIYFDIYNQNTESIRSIKNGSFNLKVIPL